MLSECAQELLTPANLQLLLSQLAALTTPGMPAASAIPARAPLPTPTAVPAAPRFDSLPSAASIPQQLSGSIAQQALSMNTGLIDYLKVSSIEVESIVHTSPVVMVRPLKFTTPMPQLLFGLCTGTADTSRAGTVSVPADRSSNLWHASCFSSSCPCYPSKIDDCASCTLQQFCTSCSLHPSMGAQRQHSAGCTHEHSTR